MKIQFRHNNSFFFIAKQPRKFSITRHLEKSPWNIFFFLLSSIIKLFLSLLLLYCSIEIWWFMYERKKKEIWISQFSLNFAKNNVAAFEWLTSEITTTYHPKLYYLYHTTAAIRLSANERQRKWERNNEKCVNKHFNLLKVFLWNRIFIFVRKEKFLRFGANKSKAICFIYNFFFFMYLDRINEHLSIRTNWYS